MTIPKKPGVYALKALDSKLIYIGSSKALQTRRTVHMSNIRHSRIDKGCRLMIDAYHAGDYITFEVLELCDNYVDREQHWLDLYKADNTYTLINQFDADRNNSSTTEDFREKMSTIRKKRWEDPVYRDYILERGKGTRFTADRLNKPTHIFLKGVYIGKFVSAYYAAQSINGARQSINAAARGNFGGKFKYKDYIIVYDWVLDKLDELLETHHELRAISSQAWEAAKSTRTVQRLTGEQCKQ